MAEKVFKFIGSNAENDGDRYEATFQLPDDGCPDSEQFLKVSVVTHEFDSPEIILEVLTSNGKKVRRLCAVETDNIEALSCLLYGTARLRIIQVLDPV